MSGSFDSVPAHNKRGAKDGRKSPPVEAANERVGHVHDVLRSNGDPLDASLRALMEERFGQDFEEVRVHTDSEASESAAGVGAKAYTVGHHIVFKQGEFVPDTSSGRHSIAHELAHVVQQRRGGGPAPALDLNIDSEPDHALEHGAHDAADRAMAGGAGTVEVAGTSSPGLARQEDDQPWYKKGWNKAKEVGGSAAGSLKATYGDAKSAVVTKAADLYKKAEPTITSVKETVAKEIEAPTLDEKIAGALESYASKKDPSSKTGAFLQSASMVVTATANAGSGSRRALARGLLEGKPGKAVTDWQASMDAGMKDLKTSVNQGIEAYEDGKFGNPVPYVMLATPLAPVGGALLGVDKLTGGKGSSTFRQVQGGLAKSLYSMGEGIAGIVVHPMNTAEGLGKLAEMGSPLPSRDTISNAFGLVKDLVDPKVSAKDAGRRYLAAEEAKQKKRLAEGKQLIKGLGENYIDAWHKERYGEIPGLLLGDVGSFFIGAGEAKAAATTAKTASTMGKVGEVAKVVKVAEGVGDVGKVAEGTKALTATAEGTKALSATAEGTKALSATAEGTKALDVAADVAKPAEAVKPAEASKAADTAADVAKPSEASKSVEASKTAEGAKPLETPGTVKPAEPAKAPELPKAPEAPPPQKAVPEPSAGGPPKKPPAEGPKAPREPGGGGSGTGGRGGRKPKKKRGQPGERDQLKEQGRESREAGDWSKQGEREQRSAGSQRQQGRAQERADLRNTEPARQAKGFREAQDLRQRAKAGEFSNLAEKNKHKAARQFEKKLADSGMGKQRVSKWKGDFFEDVMATDAQRKAGNTQKGYRNRGPLLEGEARQGSAIPDERKVKRLDDGRRAVVNVERKNYALEKMTQQEAEAVARKQAGELTRKTAHLPEGELHKITHLEEPALEVQRAMNEHYFRPGSPIRGVQYGRRYWKNPNLP